LECLPAQRPTYPPALTKDLKNWEATPEHKRRRLLKQELETEEVKTRKDMFSNLNMTVQECVLKETMTEDEKKTWMGKLSRHEITFGIDSILDTAATPQRFKQLGVKEYRSGKHVDICSLCKKEKGTLGHILGHCDAALGKTESSFNRIA
jgi:hypothetical protein